MASLKHSLKKVEKELIGLWKFRQRGKKPMWCTTFCFEGDYYDTYGKATPETALEACYQELCKLKEQHNGNVKKTQRR